MHVIVCGAGLVGYSLIEHLQRDPLFSVSVIDASAANIQNCTQNLDVEGHVGHASHPDVLARAGAEKAEMLISVTRHDEINMVACQVAETFFHIPHRLARVRHPAYLQPQWTELFGENGIAATRVISPEQEVARALTRRLQIPGAVEVLPLAGERALFIGMRATNTTTVLHRPLREIAELFPEINATLVAIERDAKIAAAHRNEQLKPGDTAYFVVERAHLARFQEAFTGTQAEPYRRVAIFGAGNVALNMVLHMNAELGDKMPHCQLIERDPDQAKRAAQQLKPGIVRGGDVLDETTLKEENIQDTDLAVAVTNSDQTNILSCALAKRLGAKRAIALVSSPSIDSMVASLGLDGSLNPRELVFSSVLRHLRRGRILFLYALPHDGGEIFVAELLEKGSSLLNHTLRDLSLPRGLRLGAVIREGHFVLPRGNATFKLGDTLIFYAEAGVRARIESLLSVQFGLL
ncbi:MAG: Trk system potassium transporter TrkA [Alphaproteobacteria bacterium]|nr:Trk system potassium transporter TrkA [Alphaproteobacteria bacterium]MDA7983786.1 Trk system potassium transporter TrkA [Alphaproteobacteria bacterium]MDA7988229.1 Trk system potassium transporter TrkA [Alphaproteobacteria bacterium]MDA8010007.1 Trk system potassium transporter TrkA [Alphaproteobacteria bacterium]